MSFSAPLTLSIVFSVTPASTLIASANTWISPPRLCRLPLNSTLSVKRSPAPMSGAPEWLP